MRAVSCLRGFNISAVVIVKQNFPDLVWNLPVERITFSSPILNAQDLSGLSPLEMQD